MGAVVDWRGVTRTWCRDKPNVSITWVHSTETSVRHSKSSEMWPGQICLISLPMGRYRITCLPLRREPPDHKAHCWRVSTHCIPWRPATSTRNGSRRSGMVIETVYETVSVPNEQQQQPFLAAYLPIDPLQSQLLIRCANFVNSCVNSSNIMLKLLSSLALQGSGSQMANNCNLIKSVYRIDSFCHCAPECALNIRTWVFTCNLRELSVTTYNSWVL